MRSLSLFALVLLASPSVAMQAQVTQLTQAPFTVLDSGTVSGDRIVLASGGSEGAVFEKVAGSWTQVSVFTQPVGLPFGVWPVAAGDGDTVVSGHGGYGNFMGTAQTLDLATGLEATLPMSTAQPFDSMGTGLAISGDTLVVAGSMSVWDSGACGPGKCFIYERQGTEWVEQDTFNPHGFTNEMIMYGVQVSTDGSTVVIGASWDDEFAPTGGAAYVYERVGDVWAETAKLSCSAMQATLQFGTAVAVDGDQIAVSTGAESVVLFNRSPGGWDEAQTVEPSDGLNLDGFGRSIGLSDQRLAVGAPNQADAQGFGVGAIYIFENQGGTWTETEKVLDPSSSGGFGSVVEISGTTILSIGQRWGAISHVIELSDLQFMTNYCVSTANSTGAAAVISALGSDSIESNNLTLIADNVPPGQPGLFLFGQNENSAFQWNGTLCVAPQFYRLPFAMSDATGRMTTALNFTTSPADVITGGNTWRFQAIFRDTVGTGVDMSEGLQIVMFP